jgi:hypothetical protein
LGVKLGHTTIPIPKRTPNTESSLAVPARV